MAGRPARAPLASEYLLTGDGQSQQPPPTAPRHASAPPPPTGHCRPTSRCHRAAGHAHPAAARAQRTGPGPARDRRGRHAHTAEAVPTGGQCSPTRAPRADAVQAGPCRSARRMHGWGLACLRAATPGGHGPAGRPRAAPGARPRRPVSPDGLTCTATDPWQAGSPWEHRQPARQHRRACPGHFPHAGRSGSSARGWPGSDPGRRRSARPRPARVTTHRPCTGGRGRGAHPRQWPHQPLPRHRPLPPHRCLLPRQCLPPHRCLLARPCQSPHPAAWPDVRDSHRQRFLPAGTTGASMRRPGPACRVSTVSFDQLTESCAVESRLPESQPIRLACRDVRVRGGRRL